MFIHNDEATCFDVVIQGTQKVIMVGHHNFKDRALIKRWRTSQKKNKKGKKFMDENKRNNHCKSFSFTARGHVFFRSYSVQRKMSVENIIEKLQKVTTEKET